MKHAILITAYKNYNHLEKIIACFDENFEIYIHIDKKSKFSKKWLIKFQNYKNVELVCQKYRVNWGGLNHLKSILYLSEMALKKRDIGYFHLISGHDYPIKKPLEFLGYFSNKNTQFINCFEVPSIGWDGNGGLDRIEYFNPFDLLNWKNEFQRKVIKKIMKFQKDNGIKRSLSLKTPKLYGGSTWWSLSRDCLHYVISYTKSDKSFLNRLKYTFCSEEFYFQTVIMNSHFKNSVENNNLRYIDWSNRNGNNPSVLDETDLDKLLKSKSFFARRFDHPTSNELLNKIKELLK